MESKLKRFWTGLGRRLLRRAVRFYYPVIEISPRENLPSDGAILYVANHANSLVDPVVIGVVARGPVCFLAKAPLFSIPVFGKLLYALGMVPVFRKQDDPGQMNRNLEALSAAAEVLVEGKSIGIFPEGKSHDAVGIAKVRSGAARLALQAIEKGAKKLSIVPLGINYEEKEYSRSAIWVRVGKPIDLCRWVETHGSDRQAVRALTTEIETQLQQLVAHLPQASWEPYLEDLETLVPAKSRGLAVIHQRKMLADAMSHYFQSDPEHATALSAELIAHREALQRSGLSMQSDLFRLRGGALFLRQFWDILFFIVASIPAAVGVLYNAVPFMLSRSLAALLPQPGSMTVALGRLGFGIPIFGLWYGVGWWFFSGYFVPWVAIAWNSVMMLFGILALHYGRTAQRFWLLWWFEFKMLFDVKKLHQFRKAQRELQDKFSKLAETFCQETGVSEAPRRRRPRRAYVAGVLSAGFVVGLLAMVALFISISSQELRPDEFMSQGPAISGMPEHEIEKTISRDEENIREIIKNLTLLKESAEQVHTTFLKGNRSFYTQKDDDEVRQLVFRYLSYQQELMHLIWFYQNYNSIENENTRLRALLLETAAAATLFTTAHHFVDIFQDEPDTIRKLNEAEPIWGIPGGVYDAVRANLMHEGNRKRLAGLLEKFYAERPAIEKLGLLEQRGSFEQVISELGKRKASLQQDMLPQQVRLWFEDMLEVGEGARYRGQAFVSTLVGDTRVRQPRDGQALIRSEQLLAMREKMLPGDIVVERQNWFLSRAFMPGYWAHAAIYVGTAEELIAMGLDKDPRVAQHLEKFSKLSDDGTAFDILEAVPVGVRMTTTKHCLGIADSAAVLRPLVSEEQRKEAIARAFSHLDKSYDFEFDFFSSDKLVCTELVYRAYDGALNLPLVNVMGRMTLPPTELVRSFAAGRSQEQPQFAFVAFLDGDEKQGSAEFRDEEALANSCTRPSMTWLQ